MGHNCGTTCKRKTGERCDTCRVGGGRRARVVIVDANGKPVKPEGKRPHATPHEKGAAVDMYFDGLSYRRVARNMGEYFGRETTPMTVYRWVRELSGKADDVLRRMKVHTGREWVADEMVVNVGGQKLWLFNVMDADTRFVLAAYLTPERTVRAAQTTLALARERADNPPEELRTDGLRLTAKHCPGLSLPARLIISSARGYGRKSTTTFPRGCKGHSETGTRCYAGWRDGTRGKRTLMGLSCITTISGPTNP